MGLQSIGVFEDFLELGGDSIMSIQIEARARVAGLKLSAKQVFAAPTVAGLAALSEALIEEPQEDPEQIQGPVPLSPIQHWQLEGDAKTQAIFAQSIVLESKEALDLPKLEAALRHCQARHDALRSSFRKDDAGWSASILAFDACPAPNIEVTRAMQARRSSPSPSPRASTSRRAASSQAPYCVATTERIGSCSSLITSSSTPSLGAPSFTTLNAPTEPMTPRPWQQQLETLGREP